MRKFDGESEVISDEKIHASEFHNSGSELRAVHALIVDLILAN